MVVKLTWGREDEEQSKEKEKPGKISKCWESDPLFQGLKIAENSEEML